MIGSCVDWASGRAKSVHSPPGVAQTQPLDSSAFAVALHAGIVWEELYIAESGPDRSSPSAKCYAVSKPFRALCEKHQIKQSFTRPYTPKTNGKAERFIQTLKRRWAYRRAHRTSAIRTASLRPWIKHYNHERPHRELGKRPPFARLREARQQRA